MDTTKRLFLYLDLNNYIVDGKGGPLIYHVSRHCKNKRILYDPQNSRSYNLVYDQNITTLGIKKLDKFQYYKEEKKNIKLKEKSSKDKPE